VLVKSIDNSILTSFRTLKKENNTVSETLKVIHRQFQPLRQKGLYFRLNKGTHLYPLTDSEEALDVAAYHIMQEK